jgi:diadenylate cyclase
LAEVLNNVWNQLLNMQWPDYLDILLVTFLIYKVLPLLRSAGTAQIVKGIVMVIVVYWVTGFLNMYAMHYMVGQVMNVGLLALVVLFAPELRRILDHLGNVKIGKFFSEKYATQDMNKVISQTAIACEQLSKEKVQHISVLQHAIAQPGSQSRVTAVQPIPGNIIFQHTVGPGCLLPAGDQRIQRSPSCVHQNPSRGWPRK